MISNNWEDWIWKMGDAQPAQPAPLRPTMNIEQPNPSEVKLEWLKEAHLFTFADNSVWSLEAFQTKVSLLTQLAGPDGIDGDGTVIALSQWQVTGPDSDGKYALAAVTTGRAPIFGFLASSTGDS